MTESFVNIINGLEYVLDKDIDKSYYDGDNTIHLTEKEFYEMKKEIGL
jgi:hypothetical protein